MSKLTIPVTCFFNCGPVYHQFDRTGIRTSPFILVACQSSPLDRPRSSDTKSVVRSILHCTTPSCINCPFQKVGECLTSGTTHLITCLEFREGHVREAGRALCVRFKEHAGGLRSSQAFTPLDEHKQRRHAAAVLGWR